MKWKNGAELLPNKEFLSYIKNDYFELTGKKLTYSDMEEWTHYSIKTLESYFAWGENCRELPWIVKRVMYMEVIRLKKNGSVYKSKSAIAKRKTATKLKKERDVFFSNNVEKVHDSVLRFEQLYGLAELSRKTTFISYGTIYRFAKTKKCSLVTLEKLTNILV